MKPYFEKDGCVIYHGDCREILPQLPMVDLVLTDPPYNAGKSYGDGTDDSRPKDEYVAWLSNIIGLCEAASTGPVFVFLSVNGMLSLSKVRRPRHVCAWTKPISFTCRQGGSPFLPHWEPCLVFGKTWGPGGRVPSWHLSDTWRYNPAKKNGHPCPKPERLLLEILRATPAQSVLDPFMGSGTTMVAARDAGMSAIGIEIEERYCEIAARRLSQGVLAFPGVSQ